MRLQLLASEIQLSAIKPRFPQRLQFPFSGVSNTVLVFDTSGSMGEINSSGLRKIEAARRAGEQIVNVISAENIALGTSSQIGISRYNSTASVVSPLTADIAAVQSGLNTLSPAGRTAMADGLKPD